MKKFLFLIAVCFFFLVGIFVFEGLRFNDGKLHIVICNVGQGDAIFIRTPKGQDILVDGGPDSSVLSCLSNHMPFWDRTIELVFATHPDADHISGLVSVLESYKVLSFNTSKKTSGTRVFAKLQSLIIAQDIPLRYIYAGDRYSLSSDISLLTLWPTHEYVDADAGSADTNSFSLVQVLSFGNFKALLTGDIEYQRLDNIFPSLYKIDILKVPHHGSKTGLNEQVLRMLKPDLAVISVGAKNRYGHPTPFILNLLKDAGIKTLRTDRDGEVEIISDGKIWQVR